MKSNLDQLRSFFFISSKRKQLEIYITFVKILQIINANECFSYGFRCKNNITLKNCYIMQNMLKYGR